MKLFNVVEKFGILGLCTACLTATPWRAIAIAAPQNPTQTQQMDKSNGDNPPPKPTPKPGPRDGGADD